MKTNLSNYNKEEFEIEGTVLKKYRLRKQSGEVQIPEGVTQIADGAFCSCVNLIRVEIPNGVTEIGEDAFCHCYKLREVTFPEGLKSIGICAFQKCTDLEEIALPDSVISVGFGAFAETEWLQNQWYGEIYVGKVLYHFKGEMLKNTVLKVKDGTKGISPQALFGQKGLTEVVLPDSVEYIGDVAFGDCINLTGLHVNGANPYFKSENNCILSKDGQVLILGCKSSVIPDSVTEIAGGAFEACEFERIYIPAGVKKIGAYAFTRSMREFPVPEIYCNASRRRVGWDEEWLAGVGRKPKVVWGYKGGKNGN